MELTFRLFPTQQNLETRSFPDFLMKVINVLRAYLKTHLRIFDLEKLPCDVKMFYIIPAEKVLIVDNLNRR